MNSKTKGCQQPKSYIFGFKKKDWSAEENEKRHKIMFAEHSKNESEYYTHFHIISGEEHPELFLRWLLDYKNLVMSRAITPFSKRDIL